MKKYLIEIFALIIGCICATFFFFTKECEDPIKRPITIKATVETEHETDGLQFYYTTDSSDFFNPINSIETGKINGKKNIKLKLYADRICKFRLDFGSAPGLVRVSNLRIIGDKTININDFTNVEKLDIDKFERKGDEFSIYSDKLDPRFLFKYPINVNAKDMSETDIVYSAICFFLASFLSYVCLIIALKIFCAGKHHKNSRLFGSALLIAALALLISMMLTRKVSIKAPDNFEITFKTKTDTTVDFAVYYTITPTQIYNEDMTLRKKMEAGESSILFQLSSPRIYNLRFDFGDKPGHVVINDLTIKGEIPFCFNDTVKIIHNDIDSFFIDKETISFSSQKIDPYFHTKSPIDLECHHTILLNKKVFLSIAILVFAFFFLLAKLIIKRSNNVPAEDILLAIAFLAICCAPSFFLTNDETSLSENRNLAPLPILKTDTGLNFDYTTQFDSWYNDHIGWRDKIVEINNKIFASKITGDAFEGKDGWLFYKGISNCALYSYANSCMISDGNMDTIKCYLTTINEWCKAHNKKFYFLICPNKSTIYGEYMKYVNKIDKDENSDAMRLTKCLKEVGINVVFSKDELLKHKRKGEWLYFKQDSHPTFLGAYYSYKAIMDVIAKDINAEAIRIDSLHWTKENTYKDFDLKRYMKGLVEDDTTMYLYTRLSDMEGDICGGYDRIINKKKPLHDMYLLGDSYVKYLQNFLPYSFHTLTINMENQYYFTDEAIEYIEKNNDVILLEIVERNIPILNVQPLPQHLKPYKAIALKNLGMDRGDSLKNATNLEE